MEVQLIKLNKIKVNDKNPRTITEDKLRRLIESILVFPKMLSIRPIVVDDKGVALGGNMRTRALKEIKKIGRDAIPERLQQIRQYANKPQEEKNELLAHWDVWFKDETVPVIHAESLTEEEKREFIIKDNSSFGAWDWDVLANEWESEQLEDWGVDTWQIDETEDEGNDNEVNEDNFDAGNETITPKVQYGDIWLLGEHRLMSGDSTDTDAVAKLMNGEKAVMTFSDAPYNVDFKGSMSNTTVNGVMVKHKGANTRHDAIHNDKMNKDDFFAFMMKILENIKQNVTGAWYLSFSSVNLEELLNPLRASGMDWKSIIIWMKNQATLSMKDYKSRYEPIVYGRFNDAWYGNRGFEEDIWEYQRTLKNDLHPTMKPVPLIGKMVTDGSKEGEIVLDLFGGSGSTLIACEQLHRKCRMMELDPHYCDVIIARWEMLTGEQAVKIG